MHNQIFVNLPVRDLDRSIRFFTAIGYTFNPTFTDENATCMILGENLFAMLLVAPYFETFTGLAPVDAHRQVEVILAVPLESREEVDAHLRKVLDAGGTESRPAQDHGFMYLRAYQDPDGHRWEAFHMSGDPPA